jgi:hypothetical protein
MVEAALSPLHVKGGSPCEYPHIDLITEEIGIHESLLHSSIQSDISVCALNTKIQENHVIANPVTENKSVFLENEGDVPDEATTTSQDRCLQN